MGTGLLEPYSPEWIFLNQPDATLQNSLQKRHVPEKESCLTGELMYV